MEVLSVGSRVTCRKRKSDNQHGPLEVTRFSEVIPDRLIQEVGTNPQETIGNDNWLEKNGVNVLFDLNRYMLRQLTSLGITPYVAEALVNHGHNPKRLQTEFLGKISEGTWRRSGDKILFDDLVLLFHAAGFNKGIILVDEMERITQPQNTDERRAFTDSLRYYFNLMDYVRMPESPSLTLCSQSTRMYKNC